MWISSCLQSLTLTRLRLVQPETEPQNIMVLSQVHLIYPNSLNLSAQAIFTSI